jgi:Delta7-sterol 5-desaturase
MEPIMPTDPTTTEIITLMLTRAPHIFVFDLSRYLIAALLIGAVVWGLRRTAWASRKIQKREANASDFRRELFASVRTVGIYTIVSLFIVWGTMTGLYPPMFGLDYGLWGNLGIFAAILIAHDAYFYWSHRTMHHPKLFKTFHRFHHKTITPTAWAAYSFAIPEAVVMALFIPVWLFFVPTPGIVVFAFLAVMIIRNCMGHAGLELHARGWASHPLLKWISTTTHHDLHHAGSFNHNFGFYFTFWDKIMRTEHPDYVATFDRVTAKPVEHPAQTAAA